MHIRGIAFTLLGSLAVLSAIGCNSETSPLFSSPDNQPKPPNSVTRYESPQPRSGILQDHLNAYRTQAFGNANFNVTHDDVLYTTAFRHAVYLNTVNSAGYNPASSTNNPVAGTVITAGSPYSVLDGEGQLASGGSPYPTFFTNSDLYPRVEAVVGGQTLLTSVGASRSMVAETFIFDGDIWTSSGGISEFRGYAAASADPIEQAWYSRRSRQHLMRAALRYVGYGPKDDRLSNGSQVQPPYPILNGRFSGSLVMVYSTPMAGAMSIWPNDGNTNVNPYGLDTDMNGPDQYCGPPIHVTLPVSDPLLKTIGVTALNLTRVDSYGGVAIAPAGEYANAERRQFRVFSNVTGLVITSAPDPTGGFQIIGDRAPVISNAVMLRSTTIANNVLSYDYRIEFGSGVTLGTAAVPRVVAGDQLTIDVAAKVSPAPTSASIGTYTYEIRSVDYDTNSVVVRIPVFETSVSPFEKSPTTPDTLMIRYGAEANVVLSVTGVGSGQTLASVDTIMQLANGELVIIPTSPLEKNSWYRFQVQAKTQSYDSGTQTIFFRTNGRGY